MAAHTPGPWTSLSDAPRKAKDDPFWMALVTTPHATKAIDCTCSGRNRGEDDANARLIAAAPDLLEALVEAQKRLRGDDDAMPLKDLRPIVAAAITKARPQPDSGPS